MASIQLRRSQSLRPANQPCADHDDRHRLHSIFFFFNYPAPTEIYPLPLPDPLPISAAQEDEPCPALGRAIQAALHAGAEGGDSPPHPVDEEGAARAGRGHRPPPRDAGAQTQRSEEHTSELQSQSNLVCRLLLEKKNK